MIATEAAAIAGTQLYRDVLAYARFGEHRTGSPADHATSEWLASRLSAAGLQTSLQPFHLRQFMPAAARLRVVGREVMGTPGWYPATTDPEGLTAPLSLWNPDQTGNARDTITLMSLTPSEWRWHGESIDAAALAGARAVVAVTEHPTGCLAVPGAIRAERPPPLPVLLLPGREERALHLAAAWLEPATLTLTGTDELYAEGRNVVGALARGVQWIVVSAAQSGWFRAAGERGPALALLLALAEWAARTVTRSSFLFLSATGEEARGRGMETLLDQVVPPPADVRCWLHLGPSIAVRAEGSPDSAETERSVSCSPELAMRLRWSLGDTVRLRTDDAAISEELSPMVKRGYKPLAVSGQHQYAGTPDDGPEYVDPDLLAPMAAALIRALAAFDAGVA